jgi:hypothetical protein
MGEGSASAPRRGAGLVRAAGALAFLPVLLDRAAVERAVSLLDPARERGYWLSGRVLELYVWTPLVALSGALLIPRRAGSSRPAAGLPGPSAGGCYTRSGSASW